MALARSRWPAPAPSRTAPAPRCHPAPHGGHPPRHPGASLLHLVTGDSCPGTSWGPRVQAPRAMTWAPCSAPSRGVFGYSRIQPPETLPGGRGETASSRAGQGEGRDTGTHGHGDRTAATRDGCCDTVLSCRQRSLRMHLRPQPLQRREGGTREGDGDGCEQGEKGQRGSRMSGAESLCKAKSWESCAAGQG